ncbi:Dot/Icm T4SS effector Zinc-dependent metalloprotease LegP [Robertkochia solimangrovi]|uniref:Dot/Icm T4SS effector Zinc-dependent metalloprotease LegP n=1 Tax=Robertkochia solimangrovi TaxID=2213046 RepID=UPI001180C3FF|nr:Dot/Icm T4SS effector Zinc-dependent metalloprotease LegP [Robertkochia solimangrovi]TRZ42555.1 peptidase m12a astacin [Robertkochia solimangrovi]
MAKKKASSENEHGELRSGKVAGTKLVSGTNFTNKGLQYANVDGMAMFEGDIILGSMDQIQAEFDSGLVEGVGISGSSYRWPNGVVPYTIASGFPNQNRITDAIAHWEANTRIRFVERNSTNASTYPNYVKFQTSSGCSSFCGMQGGEQPINIGSGCSTGNTIHEIGHAIGLWHEQSREDRDTFVRIEWDNILEGREHNFNQHISDGDDYGTYDYGSIMHYPVNAFSKNGNNTIVPLQPVPAGVIIGQRSGLSQGDIDAVHAMYPFINLPTIKEMTKDPISDPVVTLKEIPKDPIGDQPTFKEVRKDPIQDPVHTKKEISKDPVLDPNPTLVERIDPGFFNIRRPFVLSTPHHFNDPQNTGYDVAKMQELMNIALLIDQQIADLDAINKQLLQSLNQM